MYVLEFKTIYQLEPYYYSYSKKYFFNEDVRFWFNLNLPNCEISSSGTIFAKNIECNRIKAENVYANHLNANRIITGKIKSTSIYSRGVLAGGEITARNINANIVNANLLIASDIIAKKINAKRIEYHTVCIAINELNCMNVRSLRNNHICKCLDNIFLWG